MEVHEDFTGLHIVEHITSDVILSDIKDIILRKIQNLANYNVPRSMLPWGE